MALGATLVPDAGAQNNGRTRLTLQQALAQAREQSPTALVAMHRYRASHWQYVTFKADYRPSFDLVSTPIEWERTIALQTLPDGTDAFVPRSQANSQGLLSLSKVVSWTGGKLSLRSSLDRTEALEGEGATSYSTNPIELGYDQPLFGFNSYKWGLKIEPRRYAEARQSLVEELEGVSATTITYFFDLLTAQSVLRDAEAEHNRSDTLLAVVRRRFESGRVPENDVLQAELSNLNADLRLTRARVDAEVKQQRLGTYLGVGQAPSFDLLPATDVPVVRVDLDVAVSQARRNRPTAMAWSRTLLEADRSVAQARSSRGSTWLRASYGLSRTSDQLEDLYRETSTDQQALLTVSMPLLDWGRSRARIAVAESQREVTRRQVEQAQADFERDIFLRVSQFEIQAGQFRIATRADSIADRRYRMTRERYLSGDGDLNSLNIAQVERDSARRGYFDSLRSYWSAYYDVRRATLFDFERAQSIEPPQVAL